MAFQTLNSSNLYYPTALCPKVIEDIQTGMPPEPSLALLNLPSEPLRPIAGPLPVFEKKSPQRCDYTLLGLGTFIAMVVSAFSIEAGLLLFCLIAGFSAWEILTFPSRQDDYRQSFYKYEENLKKFNYTVAEQQKQYKDKVLFHQKQCKEIEAENQKRRQAHSRICAQLHTPEKVAAWRQSQLQTVVVRPTSLGDEVNTTQFDPRGYSEFESNSRFPGALRNYFGDKIHSLRRLSGYIPGFAYVDTSNNLSIVIDINEPYTPRQYPNSNGYLRLLHCLGQDNNRLRTFQSEDWFVLLFSERQILQYPLECCKEVARLIDSYTGSNLVQTRFSNVEELEPEPHWNEAMAEAMANQRSRLKYTKFYYIRQTQKNHESSNNQQNELNPRLEIIKLKQRLEVFFGRTNGNKWHQKTGSFPKPGYETCPMWEDWEHPEKKAIWLTFLKDAKGVKKELFLSPYKGLVREETIQVLIQCAEKKSKIPCEEYLKRRYENPKPNIES